MNKTVLLMTLAFIGTSVLLSSPARAEKLQLKLGADASVFWPTSSKTRDQLGNSWFSVGLGLSQIRVATERGSVSPELQFISQKKDNNKAVFGYLGMSYRKAIGPASSAMVPYAGASAGIGALKIEVPSENIDSGYSIRPAGSVFTGITYTEHAFAELRYTMATKVDGYDLSGLQARAGYRF